MLQVHIYNVPQFNVARTQTYLQAYIPLSTRWAATQGNKMGVMTAAPRLIIHFSAMVRWLATPHLTCSTLASMTSSFAMNLQGGVAQRLSLDLCCVATAAAAAVHLSRMPPPSPPSGCAAGAAAPLSALDTPQAAVKHMCCRDSRLC
jgi:hypothetical protein